MSVFYAAVMFTFLKVISSLNNMTTPIPNTTHHVPISKACKVGTIAVNDCNKCICTSDHFYNCVSIPCNQTVFKIHEIKVLCTPEMLYMKNGTACLCKGDGSWPHETCNSVFNSLPVKPKDICKPNSYVIVGCNVCKCGSNGKINKDRCTKNKCSSQSYKNKSRRYIRYNQVYGSCQAYNWYSLAPCQLCYCISENKLICNTGSNYSRTLQLGSYNLSVCGKELIRDAINLMPGRDSLRFEATSEPISIEMTIDYNAIDRENNQNTNLRQDVQQKENSSEESEEYETESVELKVASKPIIEASSTKSPYVKDEDNTSSDSETENKDSLEQFAIDMKAPTTTDEPVLKIGDKPYSSTPDTYNWHQYFEWNPKLKSNKAKMSDSSILGEVLKPVFDKVFKMALRKSMVSLDANAGCTPGATTVLKCNACFCLKNHKLLCTNNVCK